MTAMLEQTWTDVCEYDRLQPELGARALVGDTAVALVRTADGAVHAVGDLDPFSGASVLSRGIVGSRGDVPTLQSPMYKQAFDLRTGCCLDDPDTRIPVYGVRVVDGRVHVTVP